MGRRTLRQTWWVAAAGFLLVSCGSSAPISSPTTTTGAVTTSSTASPTTSSVSNCSASGLSPVVPGEAGLPSAVAAMRADLARAAATCDWTALAGLVDRNGPGLRFSFGAETDPVGYWKAEEQRPGAVAPMKALRLLLTLPFARQAIPGGPDAYTWPAAFASEHPTEAQLQEVAATGLYSMAMLNGWLQGGNNYLGYRVTILGTGDWTLFVTGD